MMKDDDEETPLMDNANATDEIIPSKPATPGDAKQRGVRKTQVARDPTKRKSRIKTDENAAAIAIKYSALFLLVAQMVGLVLLMRYSRTVHDDSEQPLYLASTAVFVMEVMKLVICCGVIAHQSGGKLFSELNTHVIHSPLEMLKLSVPSLLYTVQNNLLYLALTNLDAATYQVCYQLKILTTAVFSMVLLQVSHVASTTSDRPTVSLILKISFSASFPFKSGRPCSCLQLACRSSKYQEAEIMVPRIRRRTIGL
jgi:hypothetical protein